MGFYAPKQFLTNHPFLGMGEGNNGFFRFKKDGIWFNCIASDGGGWEHVSVSLDRRRCPTWEEMSLVKDLFWDPEDCVVQFHPPKSQYVNTHPFVLHLWKRTNEIFGTPPTWMIGVK